MQIKIHFCIVVTHKQEHKIHYSCVDYEEGAGVFDLSNRTDGESVSDYPLLQLLQGVELVVYCHCSCCQVSALPSFMHLKTTNWIFGGISAQTDNMWSKIHIVFTWGLKVLV